MILTGQASRFGWSALAVIVFLTPAFAAKVDFETVPLGTSFGGTFGNNPGDVVLTQDGINMSVENFHLNTFTGFFKAQVGGQYDDAFPTTPLSMDNINAKFDFSGLGFAVTQVTLEYAEFGGGNNFAVNGGPIVEIAPLSSLSPDVAPGVTAVADDHSITLTGPISSFLIGGQELAIDNIVAVPEPATVALLAVSGLAMGLHRRFRR